MFRPLAAIFSAILMVAQPMVAKAVVGDDYTRAKPDLFCPAFVSRVVPIHQIDMPSTEHDLGTDSDFAIILTAGTPKNITGTLKFFSKGEAFKVSFTASLTKEPSGQTATATSPNRSLEAPVIYVRFPSTIALDAAWIDEPFVDGKPVDCATLPRLFSNQGSLDKVSTYADIRAHVGLSLQAQTIGKFDMHDCPQIYTDAKMIKQAPPELPSEAREMGSIHEAVVVEIALDATGHTVDVTLLQPSFYKFFNHATLEAVAKSVFNPPTFLCSPVPGFYSFRAEFNSTQ